MIFIQFLGHWYHKLIDNAYTLNLLSRSTGEAAHLAGDFDYVCVSEFPAQALSEHVAKTKKETTDFETRKNAIIACR